MKKISGIKVISAHRPVDACLAVLGLPVCLRALNSINNSTNNQYGGMNICGKIQMSGSLPNN
jgi:hypothetical protein